MAKEILSESIIMTGANGLVGHDTADRLSQTHTIENIGRTPNKSSEINHVIDIRDKDKLEHAIAGSKSQTILHLAAFFPGVDALEQYRNSGETSEAWQVNVDAAAQMARLAKKYGKYLIHASTSYVFDGQNGPYNEDIDPNTSKDELLSYYGILKREAENQIQEISSGFAIVRFEIPFGTNHPNKIDFPKWVLEKYQSGELPSMFSDQQITPISITKFSDAIAILIENKKGGIYHIASNDVTSPHRFATDILGHFLPEQDIFIREDRYQDYPIPKGKAIRPLKGGLIVNNIKSFGYEVKTSQQMIQNSLPSKQHSE